MKPNKWPSEYLHNPKPDKTVEEMWDILDGYTFEEQFEQPHLHDKINFVIPLPPLKYNGQMVKGMFFSQAVDTIVERFPRIKEIFIPIANSMFTSYPASEHADCLFVCYNNEDRMKYYKEKYPEKKDKILIPLQDADFLNEYEMAPTFNTLKTLDVFCCMTPYPFKNLPMLARALKIYEKKFCYRLKVKCALGIPDIKKNPDGSLDYSGLRDDLQNQLRMVDDILMDTPKYIDFVPYIDHRSLAHEYPSARCCVLSSILEGKNRFIQEAMSCNTPVIVFKDFNKFARGTYPAFLDNSGEYVPHFSDVAL
ncbi:hypothetical protein IJ670_01015, partial [bacterium]|nr:hypothetical protein [bacterium]